jgi:hypothetical protein
MINADLRLTAGARCAQPIRRDSEQTAAPGRRTAFKSLWRYPDIHNLCRPMRALTAPGPIASTLPTALRAVAVAYPGQTLHMNPALLGPGAVRLCMQIQEN